MKRHGLRPRFRFGPVWPAAGSGFARVFPFRKSLLAIGILAAFDAAFLIPAVATFHQAAAAWGRFDSLFDLTAAVFLTAWLMGWSIAPLLMTGVLLMMLLGREVLKVRPGSVELSIGLPLIGLTSVYRAANMRNLRFVEPPPKSGTSWRGGHLVFDYGANSVEFGSGLDAARAAELQRAIETAARTAIRSGEAQPQELAGDWEPPAPQGVDALATEQAIAPTEPRSLTGPTALMLMAANLVPIAGTLFLGWRLSDVMVLYWAESAIIGFFNLCKIAVIGRWIAVPAGVFFVSHFGAFMAVHFLFIYTLFVEGPQNAGSAGDLRDVLGLFVALWPALLALFLSHGYSFVANFLGRQEYRGRQVKDQMAEPYTRIVFMHLVLIFGGFLTLLLGSPTAVILLVILLKIGLDLRAHLKEHEPPDAGSKSAD